MPAKAKSKKTEDAVVDKGATAAAEQEARERYQAYLQLAQTP